MAKINGLSARLKSCPVTKRQGRLFPQPGASCSVTRHSKGDFFSSLWSRALLQSTPERRVFQRPVEGVLHPLAGCILARRWREGGHTLPTGCAVPEGTRIVNVAYPALKRWAIMSPSRFAGLRISSGDSDRGLDRGTGAEGGRRPRGVCVVAVPPLRGSVVFPTSPGAYAPG